MLVLSRKEYQQIHIGENVVVTVVRIRGEQVQIGIEAPADVPIHRREVLERLRLRAEEQKDHDAA